MGELCAIHPNTAGAVIEKFDPSIPVVTVAQGFLKLPVPCQIERVGVVGFDPREGVSPVEPDTHHRTREPWTGSGAAGLTHPTLAGIGKKRVHQMKLLDDQFVTGLPEEAA